MEFENRNKKNYSALIIAVVLIFTNIITAFAAAIITSIVSHPTPYPLPDYEFNYTSEADISAAICDAYKYNIVEVRAGSSAGTGIIMEYEQSRPIILTNFHVISSSPHLPSNVLDDSQISIGFYGSLGYSDYGRVEILGFDAYNDIAVLRFKDKVREARDIVNTLDGEGELKHIGTTRTVAMGQRVVAIGNALGKGVSACDGIISLKETVITTYDKSVLVMQTTTPINGGNSGGPLIDMSGKIVGINTYQSRSATVNGSMEVVDNISFSVPIDMAMAIYKNIVSNPKTEGATKDRQADVYNIRILGNDLADFVVGRMIDRSYDILEFYNERQSFKAGAVLAESELTQEMRGIEQGDTIVSIGEYELYTEVNGESVCNMSRINIMAELLTYSKSGSGDALVIKYLHGGSEKQLVLSEYKKNI